MSQLVITQKLLSDAGGWKEMKEARAIHRAGKVSDVRYENGLLEGTVMHSGKAMRVRLKIISASNMENFCPCLRARREGIICAHALSLGLESIEPYTPNEQTVSPAQKTAPTQPKISPDWPKITEISEEGAIPTQLHLILAPNFTNSWEKGFVMLGVEAETPEDRTLLPARKPTEKLYLEARDAVLYRTLQIISPASVPGMIKMPSTEFLRLLGSLPAHPRVWLGKNKRASIAYSAYRPPLSTHNQRLRVDWSSGCTPLIAGNRAWVFIDTTFSPVAPSLPDYLQPVLETGCSLNPEWGSQAVEHLKSAFEISDAALASLPTAIQPTVILHIEGSLNHQDAELTFQYGNHTVPAGEPNPRFIEKDGQRFLTDPKFEQDTIATLEGFGFSSKGKSHWVLKDKPSILRFLAHAFPSLPDNWVITTGERFEHASSQVEPIEAGFDFRSTGENWFAMDLEFSSPSGATLTRGEIEHLLKMGQNNQQVKGGKIAVINESLITELYDVLADVDPQQSSPGTYEIDRAHAGYLQETASDSRIKFSGEIPWQTAPSKEIDAISDHLTDILRPYQKTGVEWMLNLASQGMGGILGDDMGLGKTLQTLTTIHTLGGQALVVCPSSLTSNWAAEAKRFTPDLSVHVVEGPDRIALLAENEEAHLYITSYALLRRDIDHWKSWYFDTVILDEAQHIKNPDAQVTKAANRLVADHRFALTGTPVENSTRDLWSIANFALPNYLNNRATFTERFEKPIAKGDSATQTRLARRLRPVILRRLKQEVAQDLPDKIEQVIYCHLTAKQQAVYEQILRESRETILQADGNHKRMLALTALLRLRQTCCDLRLLKLNDLDEKEASIKMDSLEELLTEAIAGNHRILVFSQFVQMLQGIVPMLAKNGFKYSYLDGSTKNRGEVVAKFQENDDIPVFLISLKAGGVGLNLTAADTVIHIDPWWNPAVEAQATDRAHRIGQTRVVTAYKLITKNTVEEKILALQNKKKEAFSSLIDQNIDLGESGLSDGELLELFD